MQWREHLMHLDHLRSVIGLRGYGQRDPLNEYKTEAFALFEKLLRDLRQNVTARLMRVEIVPPEQEAPAAADGSAQARSADRRRRDGHRHVSLAPQATAPRCAIPEPRKLGQDRPQRGLPLRLRQEVQALPRAVRLAIRLDAVAAPRKRAHPVRRGFSA